MGSSCDIITVNISSGIIISLKCLHPVAAVAVSGYLMDQSPGVLLCDGGGEDGEDLLEVQAVVGVEGAGVPHDD